MTCFAFVNTEIFSFKVRIFFFWKKSNLAFSRNAKELKKKTIKLKEKSVVIAAERGLFARLLTIAQTTSGLTSKQIFSYSLSPIPWALGLPDGGYVKTNKAKLPYEDKISRG